MAGAGSLASAHNGAGDQVGLNGFEAAPSGEQST
jgi:hypothetical protein